MNFFYIFLNCIIFYQFNFVNTIKNLSKYTLVTKQKSLLNDIFHRTHYKINIYNKNFIDKIKLKSNSFYRLIRGSSILPTFLINFTGGWIVSPTLNFLKNPSFIASSLITLLILSTSMIINDIVDIEIDKINSPNRPLVTKEISVKEAILYLLILLLITKITSNIFLPNYLQRITNYVILLIIIYTPYLKKITLIKNLFCASLVSFTIYYSALSLLTKNQVLKFYNSEILKIAHLLIFIGSLCNELLLDISDYDGDKNSSIKTVPVVFGKNASFSIIKILTMFNIIFNSYNLFKITNIYFSFILFYLLLPLYTNLENLENKNFSKDQVIKIVKSTNIPLFYSLVLLCFVVKLK